MYTAVQRAFLTRCVQYAGKPSTAANDAKCHVKSRHDGNGSQFQPANARYVRCKSSNATDDAEPATSSGLAFIFCDYFYEPRGSNTHPLSPIAVHDESANTTSRWPAGFSPPASVLFLCCDTRSDGRLRNQSHARDGRKSHGVDGPIRRSAAAAATVGGACSHAAESGAAGATCPLHVGVGD